VELVLVGGDLILASTNSCEYKKVYAREILDKIEAGKSVEYYNTIIDGNLDLNELNLPKKHIVRKNLEIESIGVSEEVKIVKSPIIIKDCLIRGSLDFGDGLFLGEIDFCGTTFDYACFAGTVFNFGSSFTGTSFNESANFEAVTFNGGSDFRRSIFRSDALFIMAKFDGWAEFQKAVFGGKADFLRAQFDNSYFNEAQFNGEVFFDFAQFSGEILTFRDAKFEEPKSQESVCRRTRNKWDEIGDKKEEDYYFYHEMEAKRKQKPWHIRYPEYILVQLVFGYGVRPFNVIITWFLLVLGFAFIYWNGHGLKEATQPVEYIWFSVATAATPGYGGYIVKPGLYQFLAILEAIFGTFMWASFIAMFARKYMK